MCVVCYTGMVSINGYEDNYDALSSEIFRNEYNRVYNQCFRNICSFLNVHDRKCFLK
jgi:hypothetical protein